MLLFGGNNKKIGDEEKKSEKCATIIRTTVIIVLLAAAAILGYIAYFVSHKYESQLQESTFDSVAEQFESYVIDNLSEKVSSLTSVAAVVSMTCPNSNNWPNCSIPYMSYENITDPLMKINNMLALTFGVILDPQHQQEFESFAYQFYNDSNYNDIGIKNFGKGIWAENISTNEIYHDLGEHFVGNRNIMVPILEVGDLPMNRQSIMFNLYSEKNRAHCIDQVLECYENTMQTSKCAAITEVLHLVQDKDFIPSAHILHPIVPLYTNSAASSSNNSSASTLVSGILLSIFHWHDVFTRAIPEYVSDLDIVLTTDEHSVYTFRVNNGEAAYIADFDKHQRQYSSQGHTFPINLFAHSAVHYTITIYPTTRYIQSFQTNSPYYAMGITVGIIICTSLLFFLYDFTMNRSAIEKELRMNIHTKRLFVRFISHEIRTPLNTVHVGLQLLCNEMSSFINLKRKNDGSSSTGISNHTSPSSTNNESIYSTCNNNTATTNNSTTTNSNNNQYLQLEDEENIPEKERNLHLIINDWINLIRDIEDSSDSAIVVLNDLLNYDKITMGTLKPEFELINLWSLVKIILKPIYVEAKKRNIYIQLNLDIHKYNISIEEKEKLNHLYVIGDRIKLGQVIRNLLSNALKFSKEYSTIIINLVWNENGLVHEKLPGIYNEILNNSMKTRSFGYIIDDNRIKPEVEMDFNRAGSFVLSVLDSGAGISKQNQLHLFQEGVQFNANQLQAGQGSGLGLWISKGIMKLHCGTLTAHSEGEGMGSEFRCELPAVLVPSNSDHRQDSQDTMNLGCANDHPPQNRMNKEGTYDQRRDSQDTINLESVYDHPQDPTNKRGAHGQGPLVKSSSNLPPKLSHAAVSRLSSHITRYDSTLDTVSEEVNDLPLLPASTGSFNHSYTTLLNHNNTNTMNHSNSNLNNTRSKNNYRSVKYIMVVDDSGPSRKVLCRLLRNSGYICEEAIDGQDCIEKIINPSEDCKEQQIDLILMDFEMPRMNGPAAAMKLKELNINIPIIGVTGNVLTADKEYFISKGAYSVLHKPLSIDELKENIKKINVKRELLGGSSSIGNSNSGMCSEKTKKNKIIREISYLGEVEEIELPV